MTTYKEIFGKQIKNLSSDPPAAISEGQIWYNTSSNTFKSTLAVAAWSSGGNLPQVISYNSGAGTQTAALSIAGQAGSTSTVENVYEYDGSSWTDSSAPVNSFYGGATPPQSAFYMAATGTQTAALIVGGGEQTNVVGEYNGSAWTSGGSYPISQVSQSSASGLQTAAINVGGYSPPPGYAPQVLTYNGSSWSVSPVAFPTPSARLSSAGTTTALLVSGGTGSPGPIAIAQEWNGSSWTTVGAPSAPKTDAKSTGVQTLALKMHGTAGATEQYNGSSWTTVANQANARDWCTGGGSNDSSGTTGVQFGGKIGGGGPTFTAATEEFTTADTVRTLTSS